ncbi:ABC transporter ATP-binding protein [Salinisphaera shabanensis E1L3A]|uniref:ABC transporter ATP-binding protein n=1 Tax=Salinisphaera shabanensis E1L3A TaxID=1033802 RepID=U2E784_9GAMM|nr:ABC transporter ATP-binding protein [Salinisphaera shabanensis]ERJ19596.1 ABC transporter ATP-binding protein [Salinisphaera shabanensis E1L3A]
MTVSNDKRAASRAILETLGVGKVFGATRALDDVTLRVAPRGIHALLGENGAGKSTLVKCLAGFHRPSSGQIMIGGRERVLRSPRDAHAAGVGMVYQHFTLAPNLTVLENLVLAVPDRNGVSARRIDWKAERARFAQQIDELPFDADLDVTVSSLSSGQKQKVEIIKQLCLGPRILILDEPTSVLTPDEADEVLGTLHEMTRDQDLAVILITHKMREVFAYADRVTVLRGGRVTGDDEIGALDADALSEMMIGEVEIAKSPERAPTAADNVLLRIENLSADNDRGVRALDDVNLTVAAGEIVGVAGVSGNGQTELAQVLAGQRRAMAGRIQVHEEVYSGTRAEISRHGMHCLPEEPLRNACVPDMSVADNLAFRHFDRPEYSLGGLFMRGAPLARRAATLMERFNVKPREPRLPMASLSGGNVQRAALARELGEDVDILVVTNPCFGLDVAAVAQIHAQLMDARNAGTAVLLISEDLDELLTLADRLVVLFEGRAVHECTREQADRRGIGQKMTGY